MAAPVDSHWSEHALERLSEAGYKRGGARTAVVETLAGHSCAVTALELEEELRRRDVRVGRASVYELSLVQRFEAARGTASYERIDPSGHHHHHAICRRCGRMEPFEDRDLEQAIGQVAKEVPFEVAEHDVVLRGLCDRCAS
ncbi:MAG: transcriptional repressor [Actinobacteria bacterium]|nr:MAG: transcriptional repressor [Actinomycetota bacterium]